MLDIALARGVSRREFGAVHAVLKTGYACDLAGAPAGSQAAEMLEGPVMFKTVTGVAEAGVAEAA